METSVAKTPRKATLHVVLIVLTLLVATTRALAQGGPGGPGGNWDVTFNRAGSKLEFRGNRVIGNPGSQTLEPFTQNMLFNGGVPSSNSIASSGYQTVYYPTPDMVPRYAVNSLDGVLKVKTTYTWRTTAGTPPAKLKLCLDGSASANWSGESGSCQASNGLGHPSVRTNTPTGGTDSQSGKRYREFTVSNGKVQIETTLSASASSAGNNAYFQINCSLSVAETNWAVALNYGSMTKYRGEGGVPVFNINSGDSSVYADTIATTTQSDFFLKLRGTLVPALIGNWSFVTNWSWTLPDNVSFSPSAPYTYGTLPATPQSASFEKGENFSANTLIDSLSSNLSASDSLNSISDDCTLKIRVHPLREKLAKIRNHTKTGGPYLHNDEDPAIRVAYNWIVLYKYDNGGTQSDTRSFTVQTDRKYEQGYSYEKSQEAGADLGSEIATLKLLFSYSETQSTLNSVGLTLGQTLTITLEPGKRTSRVICYNGTAMDWGASKWKVDGYAGDTSVVVTEGVVPVEGKFTSAIGVDWDGTVSS